MTVSIAGTNNVRQIWVGSNRIKSAYVGSNLVFTSENACIPNGLTTYATILAAANDVGTSTSITLKGVNHWVFDTTSVSEVSYIASSEGGKYNFVLTGTTTVRKEHGNWLIGDYAGNIYVHITTTVNKQETSTYPRKFFKFTYNASTHAYTKSATYTNS